MLTCTLAGEGEGVRTNGMRQGGLALEALLSWLLWREIPSKARIMAPKSLKIPPWPFELPIAAHRPQGS